MENKIKIFKNKQVGTLWNADEDNADLKAYKAAEAEFKENPKTYSFQEVLDGYDKNKR